MNKEQIFSFLRGSRELIYIVAGAMAVLLLPFDWALALTAILMMGEKINRTLKSNGNLNG